jgi:hypothetical protein
MSFVTGIMLGHDGVPLTTIDDEGNRAMCGFHSPLEEGEGNPADFNVESTIALNLLGLGINYLHSAQTTIIDVPPSRQVRRDAKRKGHPLPPSIKIIKIKDFQTIYRGIREAQQMGSGVELQAIRGHWAKYGIDGRKQLFGKYTGSFFIPAHYRGTERLGQFVKKDYKLAVSPKELP